VLPDDPAAFAGVIAIILLSLSWHEAAHAWVADRLGDPTARQLGRVTLNPIKHLDPFLSIVLPALLYTFFGFLVGGGKPVPINVMNFRHKARDFMLVALAGPGSNLVLAAGCGALFVLGVWTGLLEPMVVENPYGPAQVFAPTFLPWDQALSTPELLLKVGVLLNIGLALFNLLPVPPLDGSRVIGWMLPRPMQVRWYAMDRIGFLILIIVLLPLDGMQYVWAGMLGTFDAVGTTIDRIVTLMGAS
jgi:Zn-dependent protease